MASAAIGVGLTLVVARDAAEHLGHVRLECDDVALGLQCRNCHVNPDAGKLMTFPPSAFCMGCHQTIAKDRPAIQKLTELAAASEPIPWVRVYKVPDYVWYSHNATGLKLQSVQVFDTADASGVMPSDHRPVLATFTIQ